LTSSEQGIFNAGLIPCTNAHNNKTFIQGKT